MFRDILKFPARQAMRISLWKSSNRMREAVKINSKTCIAITTMPSFKSKYIPIKKR